MHIVVNSFFSCSSDYGRICAASVAAYTNAYNNGTDVATANFIAAKAFYQEFIAQSKNSVPTSWSHQTVSGKLKNTPGTQPP